MTKRIDILDFLKGISILTIVIFHLTLELDLPDIIMKYNPFRGVGVHTFIFVSGFSLYLSYQRNTLGNVSFFKRRFINVYVPYIFVLLIFALVYFCIGNEQLSLYSILGHVFLYKMFDESIVGSYAYYFWFISTIFQLYIIFPIIIKWKNKFGDLSVVIGGLLVSLSWSVIVMLMDKEAVRVWNSFFFQYLWEFNLGIILASVYLNKKWAFWQMRTINLLLIFVFGFFLYFILPTVFGPKAKLFNDIFGSVGFTSVLVLLYRVNIGLWREFGLMCGKYSYDIYLVHGLVFISLSMIPGKGLEMNLLYFGLFVTLLSFFSFINNYLSKRIVKSISNFTNYNGTKKNKNIV